MTSRDARNYEGPYCSPSSLSADLDGLDDKELDRDWVMVFMDTYAFDCSLSRLAELLLYVRHRYRKMIQRQNPPCSNAIMMYRMVMARSKLNKHQVRIIRRIEGMTQRDMAKIFSCTQSNICHLLRRDTWNHN